MYEYITVYNINWMQLRIHYTFPYVSNIFSSSCFRWNAPLEVTDYFPITMDVKFYRNEIKFNRLQNPSRDIFTLCERVPMCVDSNKNTPTHTNFFDIHIYECYINLYRSVNRWQCNQIFVFVILIYKMNINILFITDVTVFMETVTHKKSALSRE